MPESYLELANIREHVTYVHQNQIDEATQVAKRVVGAAIARAANLEIVPTRVIDITEKALVIGGGIAGLRSALDLADRGIKVVLVEKEPTIGGKMAMLDRTYPTDDCSI